MVLYPRYEAISMEISRCLTPIISSNNEVNILHNVMLMWLHRPSVLRTHISCVPVMPVISILQKPNSFKKVSAPEITNQIPTKNHVLDRSNQFTRHLQIVAQIRTKAQLPTTASHHAHQHQSTASQHAKPHVIKNDC